ncbi:unnamed protein product [Prunus armeniaca]
MTMTANCDICGAPMENAAHIVRNCPVAISVWHQSLMPMNLSLLQAVDLHTWWMRGFAVNLGVGQVLEVELWGIYLGLKLAWDIGCSAVVLESYSATAVHLLNKNVEDLHPLATMLWGCKDYINKNWDPPDSTRSFLSEDLLGVFMPRAIV